MVWCQTVYTILIKLYIKILFSKEETEMHFNMNNLYLILSLSQIE